MIMNQKMRNKDKKKHKERSVISLMLQQSFWVFIHEGPNSFYLRAKRKILKKILRKKGVADPAQKNKDKNLKILSRKLKKEESEMKSRKLMWDRKHYYKYPQQPLSSVVDIIICVGGKTNFLEKCVASIKKYTDDKNYRLYLVVHQNNHDFIPEYITEKAQVIIHSMKNFNFSKANNMVISHSENDVVLLNDDTEVTANWLSKLRKDSKGVALTGPHTNQYCSGNPDMWGKGQPRITSQTINMFCAYIPRKIIRIVGLLDEEFCYYGGEDVDYSYRVLKNGFPLVISSAFVHHHASQSFGSKKYQLVKESDKILLEKHNLSFPYHLTPHYPLVSVIIATRNRSTLLPRAIKSILTGHYKNLEIIIVDDASSDNTWQEIEKTQKNNPQVIGIKLPKQVGAVMARKKGFNLSSGHFIAFMDDDDIARPNRVSGPLSYLFLHPELDVLYCGYEIVSESGREPGKLGKFNFEDFRSLKLEIGSGAMLIRRKVIEEVPFMSLYERAIDYDWVFRIIRHGYKIDYYPGTVLDYNREGDANSHLSGNPKAIKVHKDIFNREKLLGFR